MNNSYETGKTIFESIRDIPYRVSEFIDDPAPNCVLKGKLLLERLGTFGFTVRGRIAQMDWNDTLLPKDIVALYPKEIMATHFYIEIMRDNNWIILDASWDKGLEKAGFPIATFDEKNSPALPLHRIFDFEEQAAYLNLWLNKTYAEDYFRKAAAFLKTTNNWLASIRSA